MTHLCIYESAKRNVSKPSENANQPRIFVDISIGQQRLHHMKSLQFYIYWHFVDMQDNNIR